MAATSIEEIHERHIKALSDAERRQLLEQLSHDLAEESSVEKKPRRSMMELHGLGKETWEGIDAQKYVNELLKKWDHGP